LYTRATTESYTKAADEDNASIAMGITGYKGRVHIAFAEQVGTQWDEAKQSAQEMDRRILGGDQLVPVNYLAYAMWEGREAELSVPEAQQLFGVEELAKAEAEWQRRLQSFPVEQRPYLILQYANPVRNQYCIKAGLPL